MRAVAQETDQDGAAEHQRPGLADRRNRQAQRRHRGAEDRNLPHPDPVGDPPHEDAAEAGTEPDQRSSQRHHRAIGVERGRDRLQPNDDDQRGAVGK